MVEAMVRWEERGPKECVLPAALPRTCSANQSSLGEVGLSLEQLTKELPS